MKVESDAGGWEGRHCTDGETGWRMGIIALGPAEDDDAMSLNHTISQDHPTM